MILAASGNLTDMFNQPFMRNAFLAGTCVALAAGLVGYFVVLRAQVFTGDALSHVAFTGALAALVIGVDLRVGLFGACVVFALLMGLLGRRGRADDAAIGSVFASILGVGALCLTLYTTSNSASNATGGVNVLFGSIFGLSGSETTTSAAIALSVSVAVVAIARPLLFASVDEAVALARGVPVRRLGLVFLVVVGVTAGEATQAVGALLLLGLIAAPAGAAQRLSARPFRALWISAAIAVLSMWIGLALAYTQPQLPPSFCILAVATGCYLLALIVTSSLMSKLRSGSTGTFARIGRSEPSVEASLHPRTGA
jgi:zinc/manganese transport system permease protein